jgi:hypothetical protein
MLSNWIEGWLSQKADQDKAAKRNVPYLTVVDQDGDPAEGYCDHSDGASGYAKGELSSLRNYEVLLRRILFQAANIISSHCFLLLWDVILAFKNHKFKQWKRRHLNLRET